MPIRRLRDTRASPDSWVEEFLRPGGFAAWDRRYRPEFRVSITPALHVIVNAALLLVCLQVAWRGGSDDIEAKQIDIAAWLAISALLFSNAVFHGVGTVRTGTYSPGVVTAMFLYMPLSVYGYWYTRAGSSYWSPLSAER
ncbi:MAG TPA: HXXEE domain-containing protein [Casimicrobiaceae bacterium]|nr:HXXEE domain-containing protein [Casimicrobiaceae bacterium]